LVALAALAALPPAAARAASATDAAGRPVVTLPSLTEAYPRPVANWLEAQIELARRAFSCGSIDGVGGARSVAALRAFQEREALPPTGELDGETTDRLQLERPPLVDRSLSAEELGRLQPLSPTWLGKSRQTALDYASALELAAEQAHASPALLRALNPAVDWNRITPATVLIVPDAAVDGPLPSAARLVIFLGDHVLEAYASDGRLIAHFPVSIARLVDHRPVGELRVVNKVRRPDYTFDPELFPESAEARSPGRKLILPPGPNNPVGLAWIGLDRPGYGIHGTPEPEHIGLTESHGCFRLTNWDALTLLDLCWIGQPVVVDP
jgi:lipoprotein-anchoring transpeptidase ErfK/SrfK